MLFTEKFIAMIREQFFNENGERQIKTPKEAMRDWQKVAHKFNTSPERAQELWQQISTEYLNYLRNSADSTGFPHAKEMQFMQTHLLQRRDNLLDLSSQSEPELDECELRRILCSDDEEAEDTDEQPKKRQKVSTPLPLPAAPKQADAPLSASSQSPAVASPQEPSAASSLNNLSSLELIFLGYAKVLQKMPRSLQLATKRKIADIMDRAETLLLDIEVNKKF